MDQSNSNIIREVRKSGSHLTLADRGMIQAFRSEHHSLRYIARKIGCSPSTILNELRRGTPKKNGTKGRNPVYTAVRGQQAYEKHRANSHRHCLIDDGSCNDFLLWAAEKIRSKEDKWSIDVCVGRARREKKFPASHIPCTKTMYNMLKKGKLPITLTDVPLVLKRKASHPSPKKGKRIRGRSIDERPPIVNQKTEIGHWEVDTVVGKKEGREAVAFTALEKVTRNYIAIRIPSRSCEGVASAIRYLQNVYGEHFAEIFKSMTADNGPEFAELANLEEQIGTKVYFAHPYQSWERGQNERCNALLRSYVPKGTSFESFSDEDVLHMADCINARPRKILGYRTAEELFDDFLDEVYRIRH